MITKQSADALALWLLKTHPDLFAAIAAKKNPRLSGLGDISDFFSSIGSDVSSAVSGVGDWLANPTNVQSLTNLASNYFKSQAVQSQANAQTAILNTQISRAQAGLAPAPITYAGNIPVYVPSAGQPIPSAIYNAGTIGAPGSSVFGYPVTATGLSTLQPTFFQRYGLMLGLAGVGAVVLLLLIRR